MKTLITFSLLAFAATGASGQLIYDFAKADFVKNDYYDGKRVKPIAVNGFARLYVRNINTFRYKVELSGSTVNYVTPIPSELQTVFRITSESSNDQNLIKGLGLLKEADKEMQEKKDKTGKQAESLRDSVDVKTANANALRTVADRTPVVAGAVMTPAQKAAQESANDAEAAVAKVQTESDAAERLKEAMKKLADACAQFVQIADRVANIKFTKMQLISVSKQQWKDHNDMLAALPATLDEAAMKRDYQNFTNYYAAAYALYDEAAQAAEEAKDAGVKVGASTLKAIKHAEETFLEGKDLFYEDNFIKLIDDITVLQHALQNPAYFKVESAPIQIDGDFMRFDLKIAPTPVNSLMPYEITREVPVELPVKGGLKVDFSVGPTISFGGNAKDEIYYLGIPDTAGKAALKMRPNNNDISPAIAAMMHFGPRSGTDVRIAGMFGVGAGLQSADNVNFSLYGGLSAVFGKRERVMLSTGVSYLRVQRLKANEYAVDNAYTAATFKIEDVTEKVFKPSFFIGLSYNLSNRIEIK